REVVFEAAWRRSNLTTGRGLHLLRRHRVIFVAKISRKYFRRPSRHAAREKSASLCSWMYVSMSPRFVLRPNSLAIRKIGKTPRRILISFKDVINLRFASSKQQIV